ncbi:MAG: alpha/beta hydrolase [Bacteroidota bacterium]
MKTKSLTIKLTSALLFIALLFSFYHSSASTETAITLKTTSGDIYGTLSLPEAGTSIPVALIIAGSGPTDRDGNNTMMKNNSLKILATHLAENGIAAVRFDKRGIAASKAAAAKEGALRFEDYINDVKGWIKVLRSDKRFSRIIVIGHSEGSLIGMIAATDADAFVSIAGAGQSADLILKEQLSSQPEEVKSVAFPIIDKLKNGFTVMDVDPSFYSLFRPTVQPYMISWFKYDPQKEIAKLTIPVLITQGTSDIQVGVDDAKRLSKALPSATLVLIEKMNHIFRITDGDREANMATYNQPELPVAPELLSSVTSFILKK